MDRIPLFPLDVVLFPGMPLPLRVFEPRYHRMLADCAAEQHGFGVVLIREGEEVGGDASPHPVGTMARIESRSDEGEVAYIVARGERRFSIARTLREKPYLEGEVEWLEEPGGKGAPLPAEAGHGHAHAAVEAEVAAMFEEYLRLLAKLTKVPLDAEIEALMRGQRRASPWATACAIGGTLLVPPEKKQPILEAGSVHDAFHAEHELLARETARLRVMARSVDAWLN